MKITSALLMVLSGLFCVLAFVVEKPNQDSFFGASLLVAIACLLWGLVLFILGKRYDLAIGCVGIGGLEMLLLCFLCAQHVA
jgi:hypothetical protein